MPIGAQREKSRKSRSNKTNQSTIVTNQPFNKIRCSTNSLFVFFNYLRFLQIFSVFYQQSPLYSALHTGYSVTGLGQNVKQTQIYNRINVFSRLSFFSSFSKSYIIGKVNELWMSTEKREDGPGEHSDTFSCVQSTRVGMASPSLDIETILISTKFVFLFRIYNRSQCQ